MHTSQNVMLPRQEDEVPEPFLRHSWMRRASVLQTHIGMAWTVHFSTMRTVMFIGKVICRATEPQENTVLLLSGTELQWHKSLLVLSQLKLLWKIKLSCQVDKAKGSI